MNIFSSSSSKHHWWKKFTNIKKTSYRITNSITRHSQPASVQTEIQKHQSTRADFQSPDLYATELESNLSYSVLFNRKHMIYPSSQNTCRVTYERIIDHNYLGDSQPNTHHKTQALANDVMLVEPTP